MQGPSHECQYTAPRSCAGDSTEDHQHLPPSHAAYLYELEVWPLAQRCVCHGHQALRTHRVGAQAVGHLGFVNQAQGLKTRWWSELQPNPSLSEIPGYVLQQRTPVAR